MWATVIVLVLLVVSGLAYWWLGRIWPETRLLQKKINEDRKRARDAMSRRPEGRGPL